MGKRIGFLFGVISCLIFSLGMSVRYSQAASASYVVEQAAPGKAPVIKMYLTGTEMSKDVSLKGSIGEGEKSIEVQLDKNQKIQTFKESSEPLRYVILVDNSGSVNKKQLQVSLNQIKKIRSGMREQDEMILYAVGANNKLAEKKKVLSAVGNKKKDIQSDNKKISLSHMKYFNGKNGKTVLYRSLKQICEEYSTPDSLDKRTVAIVVTDGEDDSEGLDIDKTDTKLAIKESNIPFYFLMLQNIAKSKNKVKMNATKRMMTPEISRAQGYYCGGSASVSPVKKAFENIKNTIMKKTYVANLRADNNKILEGNSKLSLNVVKKDSAAEIPVKIVPYVYYNVNEKDTEAPVIQNISKVNENTITFQLTDNSGNKVIGADQKENYIVQTQTEDGTGKVWEIESVKYNSLNQGGTVVLTFRESLYTDSYLLTCNNIHDDTQEQNAVSESYAFAFEGINATTESAKKLVISYWWILLIALVLIIGILLLIIMKKRPVKETEIKTDELVKADSQWIRLTITERTGAIKNVEWKVEGSLFVGRSDVCNLYFDDAQLSKQHFAIEVTKMACYITDLDSTNGTFVNGVKLTNRRMLLEGDTITAGREKFVFHLAKEKQDEESA